MLGFTPLARMIAGELLNYRVTIEEQQKIFDSPGEILGGLREAVASIVTALAKNTARAQRNEIIQTQLDDQRIVVATAFPKIWIAATGNHISCSCEKS